MSADGLGCSKTGKEVPRKKLEHEGRFVAGKLAARSRRVYVLLQSPHDAQSGVHERDVGGRLDYPARFIGPTVLFNGWLGLLRAARRLLRTVVGVAARAITSSPSGDHFLMDLVFFPTKQLVSTGFVTVFVAFEHKRYWARHR